MAKQSNPAQTVLLVCSNGGHLLQMHTLLDPVWRHYNRHWVCLPCDDAFHLLADEPVTWAHGPTNRNIKNLIRNFFLCLRVLWQVRPTHIISTGAGVAIPFFVIGRLLGARTIYIESYARQHSLSLTGKGMYHTPAAQHVIVQSAELATRYPRASYQGGVY